MVQQTSCAACATAVPFTSGTVTFTTIAIAPTAPGRTTNRERRDPAKSAATEEGDRGHNAGP